MKKIGIIASLPQELAVLEKGMTVTGRTEKAGLTTSYFVSVFIIMMNGAKEAFSAISLVTHIRPPKN